MVLMAIIPWSRAALPRALGTEDLGMTTRPGSATAARPSGEPKPVKAPAKWGDLVLRIVAVLVLLGTCSPRLSR